MYLYFNGDSFVAGSELGDDLLPEYPGLYDINSERNLADWFNGSRNTDSNTRKKLAELEYKRSFPSKIAGKLNLPFINNAKGGASMDKIARTTIADLIKLKNDTNDIVAIIGTTGWGRSEIALSKEQEHEKNIWHCIHPVAIEHADTPEIAYLRKYKILNETDYHHLINFYKNIILVKDFCELNNIRLFWISTSSNVNKIEKFNELQRHEDYVNYKKYANLNYSIDMYECIELYFKEQRVICPGGHYAEIVHDFVAARLAEIIKGI